MKEFFKWAAVYIVVTCVFLTALFCGIGIWPYKEVRSPHRIEPDIVIQRHSNGTVDSIFIYPRQIK